MAHRIAIILGFSLLTFLKEEAAAVAEEAQTRFGWDVDFFELSESTVRDLGKAQWSGAIAIGMHQPEAYVLHWLAQQAIPTVFVGEVPPIAGVHQLSPPQERVGAMAAKHLLDQGITHFAFVGVENYPSQKRRKGFVDALAVAGYDKVPAFTGLQASISMVPPGLREFLEQLPKPVGVMAWNDHAGLVVSRAASKLGIPLPEKLALIGVDDEALWCSLATPPLSSVHFPARAIGRQAAAMLDRLMTGRRVPARSAYPPFHVVPRQSTAIVHAESPEIAEAIHFLRRRYADGATVRAAAEFAGISRSTLERGVRQTLGRSPFDELMRLRLDTAKQLLINSDEPMKIIARRCGFTDNRHFTIAFRASYGMPPTRYRLQQRGYL